MSERGVAGQASPAEAVDLSRIKGIKALKERPLAQRQSALSEAYRKKEIGAFREALAAGADPNHPGDFEMSWLTWAVRDSETAFAKALLEAGAAPSLYTLQLASSRRDEADDASVEGSPAWLVSGFVKKGVSPSGVANGAESPLACCLAKGRWRSAWALIEAGADLGVAEWNSDTALSAAIRRGCARSVELLIEAGVGDPKWGVEWDKMERLARAMRVEGVESMIRSERERQALLEHGARGGDCGVGGRPRM